MVRRLIAVLAVVVVLVGGAGPVSRASGASDPIVGEWQSGKSVDFEISQIGPRAFEASFVHPYPLCPTTIKPGTVDLRDIRTQSDGTYTAQNLWWTDAADGTCVQFFWTDVTLDFKSSSTIAICGTSPESEQYVCGQLTRLEPAPECSCCSATPQPAESAGRAVAAMLPPAHRNPPYFDKVRVGELQPGVRLYLRNSWPGTPDDLPSGEYNATPVVVGQGLSLYAWCNAGRLASGPWKWTVGGVSGNGGTTSALRSYDPGRDSAHPVFLKREIEFVEPNDKTFLQFYFVRTGTFEVTAATGQNGPKVSAWFTVVAPEVKGQVLSTCAVGLDTKVPRPSKQDLPTLGPGINDLCGKKNGITFEFTVTPQVSGKIGVIQVVAQRINRGLRSGGVDTYNKNPEPFYVPVSGELTPYAPRSQPTQWHGADSPGLTLTGKVGEKRSMGFQATDYVMFRAGGSLNAIWVTLAVLHWGWVGEGTKLANPDKWELGKVVPISEDSPFGPSSEEPDYSSRVNPQALL
jgi:hypothetical protein